MAKKATVVVHPAFKIGDISPRLYGAFLEPIGTMVNGTMYNPKHPTADDKGFRRDFIDALKQSGLPSVRLPGGNFVSGWDWKDSIGPLAQRKAHLDLAWFQYYSNEVGHDEYLQWAERVGTESLYTINLGTGDINDAVSIIEYTNHSGGTYWSDLRRKYGHEDPYGVKVWYLGNEMDGVWQIGSWQKDPRGYGVRANEVSKAMKWVDGSIETVVCASSSPFLNHYPSWEMEVLQECYEAVDLLSMHQYHSAPPGDIGALMGGSDYMEDYINTEIAICDYVATKLRSPKQVMLSFDEYGARFSPPPELAPGRALHNHTVGHYRFDADRDYVRHDPNNMGNMWNRHGAQGDMYNALTTASILLLFLRHADRVKIGCITGGLGALAASSADHVWSAASHYAFTDLIKYGQGTSMRTSVDCDTYDIPGYFVGGTAQYATKEGVKFIESAAALDEKDGSLNVFVINRNWDADNAIELDMRGFDGYKFVEHVQLFSDDMDARNSYEEPNNIVPTVNSGAKYENGIVTSNVKKLSWNVFRFKK